MFKCSSVQVFKCSVLISILHFHDVSGSGSSVGGLVHLSHSLRLKSGIKNSLLSGTGEVCLVPSLIRLA